MVEIVVENGVLVQAGEVLGGEAEVEDHKARIDAEDEGNGILVLPCRFRFLDDGFALDLRKAQVRDRIAESGLVVLPV